MIAIRTDFFKELEYLLNVLDASAVVVYRKDESGGYAPIFSLPKPTDATLPFVASASDLASFLRSHGSSPFQMDCDTFADNIVRRGLESHGVTHLMAAPIPTENNARYYLTVGGKKEFGTREQKIIEDSAKKLSELLIFNIMRSRIGDAQKEIHPAAILDGWPEKASSSAMQLIFGSLGNRTFGDIAQEAFDMMPQGVSAVLIEDTNGRLLGAAPKGISASRSREWLNGFCRLPYLDWMEENKLPVAVPALAEELGEARLVIPLMGAGRIIGFASILGTTECIDVCPPEIIAALIFTCTHMLCKREASRGRILEKMLDSVENERVRLAFELHDESSQNLVALKVRLSTVQRALSRDRIKDASGIVEDCMQIADEILSGINRLSATLRSNELNYLGFREAIEAAAHMRLDRANIDFEVAGNALDVRFSALQETMLLSGLDEALSNCAKHSQAEKVTIVMDDEAGWLTLSVRDDGRGFDATSAINDMFSSNCGLRSMSECARAIGGDFWIGSTQNKGTLVRFSVPINMLEGLGDER